MGVVEEAARRSMCERCLRPTRTCICDWIRTVQTDVELIVLQHPHEVAHAKGSARLLHLCVAGSRLLVGERFDPVQLAAILDAAGRRSVLLYPEQAGGTAPPALPAAPSQLRLVVLDASWRKSRKMLYLNPQLQHLPRLALAAMPPSHYRIRKAHAADQLSSMEAAAYALQRLDPANRQYGGLIEAFDGFVGQYETQTRDGRIGKNDGGVCGA